MKRGRYMLLFCAALLAAAMLCSCGVFVVNRPSDATDADDGTTAEDTSGTADTYEIYKPSYDSDMEQFLRDLSGTQRESGACKIVTAADDLITVDDNTPTVISKAYTERNGFIEDILNVSVICEKHSAETMLADLKAANRAGDYFADLIMLPQSQMGAYIADGAVANLRSLPGFNTDAEYYYPSSLGAGGGGDAVYAAAGPASITPDCLSAVYFNTELCKTLGLESPYDLVDKGEWTVDKYLEYCAAASAGGYYSTGAQNTAVYLPDLLYFGCGQKLIDVPIGAYPTLAVGSESAAAAMTKVREAYNVSGALPALESIDAFTSGKSLFLIDSLSIMSSISNSSCKWGILPMPKYDSAQSDYCSLAYYGDAMFFCVPTGAPDYTLAADLIAAVNILSYGSVPDAYVTNASYYSLRDNQSIRMMDIIISNPVYDMSYTFAETYNAVPNATFAAIRNNAGGISTVERYIGIWGDRFNNAMRSLFTVN